MDMNGSRHAAAPKSSARRSATGNGFVASTTTGTPDALFRYWLPRLSGSQLRVVLFLIRRAYGPTQQRGDGVISVSLSDFIEGTSLGGRRTVGCGIESRPTVLAAVTELERLGLIAVERATDRRSSNRYRLVVDLPPSSGPARGFARPTTTAVPDDLFDLWLARLSDVELRVLLYVTGRTLGWKKETDWIDVDQFIGGIRAGDGRVVDEGCGLKSRKHVYRGLASLEKAGLLRRSSETKVFADGNSRTVPVHGLVFAGEAPPILHDKASPLAASASALTERGRSHRAEANRISDAESEADACRDQTDASSPAQRPAEKHSAGEEPERNAARIALEGGLIRSYMATAGGITWSSVNPATGLIRSAGVVQSSHATRFNSVAGTGLIRSPQQETYNHETLSHETSHHHQGTPPEASSAQTEAGGGGPRSNTDSGDDVSTEVRAALTQHFAAGLVDRWLRRGADEGERIMAWLRYVDESSGRGLDNPIGFLRSRAEGQTWPPGAARYGNGCATSDGSDIAWPCGIDGPLAPAEETWAAICADLRQTLTEDNYRHWFGPTRALLLQDDMLTVGVPDAFYVQWLDRRLRRVIEGAVRRVAQGTVVAFEADTSGG